MDNWCCPEARNNPIAHIVMSVRRLVRYKVKYMTWHMHRRCVYVTSDLGEYSRSYFLGC